MDDWTLPTSENVGLRLVALFKIKCIDEEMLLMMYCNLMETIKIEQTNVLYVDFVIKHLIRS